ncbi:MAG: hypothetical protein K2I96_14520 [Lachnospiraceae bacterium]|nr:hypothetical protein [Lachnospiraceae bacterium]
MPGTSGAVFILGICKEGVYSAADFNEDIDGGNTISFDYYAQYQILTYDITVGLSIRKFPVCSGNHVEAY